METDEEKQETGGVKAETPKGMPEGDAQDASQGDKGGAGTAFDDPTDDGDAQAAGTEDGEDDDPSGEVAAEGATDPDAKGEKNEKDERRRKIPIIILLILALLLACACGFMLWKSTQRDVDPGATIQETSGKTTKEIQEELDEIANKSRMTISVAPAVQLKDGRARVNVVNVEDNKFNQTFTLSQDGKDVYTSGIVKCGQKVEWCDAEGLHEGTATLTVQAMDKKTDKAYGNPQSVEVKVTEDAVQ